MKLKFLPVLAILLAAAQISGAQPENAPPAIQWGVSYSRADGPNLLLDIYGATKGGHAPAVILIHGGGWSTGSRADCAEVAAAIASHGYVSFCIDSRLFTATTNKFPAQWDDCQRAVRWVRAHAADYGADSAEVGAVGASAGGHLAALLGTTDTRDNADTALAAYSSRVQCVVDLYGPTDFTGDPAKITPAEMYMKKMLQDFLGTTPEASPEKFREASPVAHVDARSAPFLIFHGALDKIVPVSQSASLDRTLRAAGIESKLIIFPTAGHAYRDGNLMNQTITAALDFLDRHLKNQTAPH